MSLLGKILGKLKSKSENESDLSEHMGYIDSLKLPTIALARTDEQVFSQIGGLPSLPQNVPWPEWKGAPLAFLCQLDLSEIPEICERNGLPALGILYFFYCQEQETWGFDPIDKGSWRVVYTNSPREKCTEHPAPDGLDPDFVYKKKSIVFRPIETYPDCQDDRIDSLNLSDRQGDQYVEVSTAVFEGEPAHHLFGYPAPIQGNDMDLECQLVSNGVYCGDASGYNSPQRKALEAHKSDWVLLFQLDTDDESEMMWGDSGMLYFWIKKDDLKEARFENCWMILQCC